MPLKKVIMKIWLTKIPVALLAISLSAISCKTLQGDPSTLPKDISERPANESSQRYDEAQLDKLKASIESLASQEKCTNASEWTFSPLGSKACGGPITYIAYPKKLEATILPIIEEYTANMSEYNKKYNITSDCMMAAEPTSIKCLNGKAELVY